MPAEPRTRPTDASVADFIAAVENPRRRGDAETMNALMAEVSGEPAVLWGPSIIGYGSYRGPTGDWPIIGFSPRKANLVLYVFRDFDGADDLLARLGRHKASVGCLYVNRLDDLDLAVLRELVERSVASMRTKYPPTGSL
ncbi:MAG: DUF1801 domain-containing protein [Brevundimonas sp.]|nr:MAG: DUF1801 domain-containing protein [Brevundimonas sp.]